MRRKVPCIHVPRAGVRAARSEARTLGPDAASRIIAMTTRRGPGDRGRSPGTAHAVSGRSAGRAGGAAGPSVENSLAAGSPARRALINGEARGEQSAETQPRACGERRGRPPSARLQPPSRVPPRGRRHFPPAAPRPPAAPCALRPAAAAPLPGAGASADLSPSLDSRETFPQTGFANEAFASHQNVGTDGRLRPHPTAALRSHKHKPYFANSTSGQSPSPSSISSGLLDKSQTKHTRPVLPLKFGNPELGRVPRRKPCRTAHWPD